MNFKITNQTDFDNRKLLDKEIKQAWIEALRSGKYEQGKGQLCYNDKYCCLGVLAHINGKLIGEESSKYILDSYDNPNSYILPEKITTEWNINECGNFQGFTIDDTNTLANLNDDKNFTFEQIAEVIELYF